ncbi:MAG TPA: hypothetical protein VG963_05175 [Polyangiaceae bacterium]|nr:hypothetical protein [Polyangiaceae bacterium]HVZ31795.1 hypothetical protein [Polyangiaceae bacterium]
MADGLSYVEKIAALNAATAASSAYIKSLAANVASRITAAGNKFDRAFPGGSLDLVNESAEHSTWRSQMADALTKLNDLCASVDGGPSGATVPAPTPEDPSHTVAISSANPNDAASAVRNRATAAISARPTIVDVISDGLHALPQEPRFHASQYYIQWTGSPTTPRPTYGEVEESLRAAMAQADAVIALA